MTAFAAAMRRIAALVRKELLAVLKDKRSRTSLFLPPILQCLLYGYAASYDLTDVPYVVIDRDRSGASHELLARLDGTGIFHRVADATSLAEMRDEVDQRRALIALQFERGFERDLFAGRAAPVQVIADGRNSNTAGVAAGYVAAIVEDFGERRRRELSLDEPPVRVVARAWYNPNLETRWNMIPALLGTLTMLQTVLLTAQSVAREREQGTFDQLLVTPLRPAEIMAGKAIPSMLIGLAQATSVLVVAQIWFRIPFAGSYLTLYAGLGLFLVAAVGMGLFISSIAGNMQQAMFFSFAMIMPFFLLSGLSTPIANMPRSLQLATSFNPLRYAIDISRRVYLEGAGIPLLAPDLWPLAAIGAVTLTFAAWMFRRRLA